jgi:exopolysaccharide biosynthesis predicted pyruvyltransferase EpsI
MGHHKSTREFDLKIFLRDFANTNVDFYRFPGNYGDSLIWHGTINLISSLNITVNYVDIDDDPLNEVLLIDGGGNFVDYYSDILNFLLKKPDVYKKIIILPHTIFGKRQIEALNIVKSDLTVFCREQISAKFVADNAKSKQVYLWHDCAFYNSFELTNSIGSGSLYALRTDTESVLSSRPSTNEDISYNGWAKKPLDDFLREIQNHEVIHTDRLHVGIAAAMLKKAVKIYPNSYYKNKAVYDYSLSQYSHVEFLNKFSGV